MLMLQPPFENSLLCLLRGDSATLAWAPEPSCGQHSPQDTRWGRGGKETEGGGRVSDRQMDRRTHTQTHTYSDTHTDAHTDRHRDTQKHTQTQRDTHTQMLPHPPPAHSVVDTSLLLQEQLVLTVVVVQALRTGRQTVVSNPGPRVQGGHAGGGRGVGGPPRT